MTDQMNGWRPIATACSSDGDVLLRLNDGTSTVGWKSGGEWYWLVSYEVGPVELQKRNNVRPTYWRPIPLPPNEEEQ